MYGSLVPESRHRWFILTPCNDTIDLLRYPGHMRGKLTSNLKGYYSYLREGGTGAYNKVVSSLRQCKSKRDYYALVPPFSASPRLKMLFLATC